jgi:serine/threonine-protein phosphatase CPPED1
MGRLLLIISATAMAATAKTPFFFIQMSDPQFGMYTGDRGYAQETANFEFAVATANRLKPAFVIVTGDLVNKPGDGVQISEYKRIAAKLDRSIPLYSVPGNHDVGNEPTPESLARYREQFGPDWYTFRSGGDLAAFVLDSSVIASPGKVPADAARQEQWLRAELEKAKRDGLRHLVVFMHHSWFLKDPGEPDQYFNIPKATRERYLELFRTCGVMYVFSGHYHRNEIGRDGQLEMVTTGPVGKPLDGARSGMRIVSVANSGLRHQFYDFGDLPGSADPGPIH